MADKQVALELAAFLDSPTANALLVRRDQVRKLADAFFSVCYDELGKAPRMLDGQDLREAVAERMPGRLAPRDPSAAHAPEVLDALLAHLQGSQVLAHAFELRQALDGAAEALVEAVASGRNAERQTAVRQAPVVHRADKVGRNAPCWCGSGVKFKKCHGKDT